VNADFLQTINQLAEQIGQSNDQSELSAQLKTLYREALRFSMQRNLNNGAAA